MPLRDHFRPPLSERRSWDELHGGWPMMIVADLNRRLPDRYVAVPQVHLGSSFEVDVAAYDQGETDPTSVGTTHGGGTATAIWAPPEPTLTIETDLADADEYEVRVYDTRSGRRLVAAVEIVSPANKDRPEHRRAFAVKCAALLLENVCVAIVDIVTTRTANLYLDVMELLGQTDPSLSDEPPAIYVVACRWARGDQTGVLRAWTHPLELGQTLPTPPLWLTDSMSVPLDLESSYEETCRTIRLP